MIDYSLFQGKKAAYYTLGCNLNLAETSPFSVMLSQLGVVKAGKDEEADICLVNTCSVTEVADHKCRQQIHKMIRNHPHAFVVVTGCYAQLSPERIADIDGVDLVLGSNEKAQLVQYLSDKWTGTMAIGHVISLKYRTAATTIAHIAQYLMHVATHAIHLSPHL